MVFNNSLKIHSPTSDRWHQVVRTQGQSRTHPSMKSATSNQQLLIFHLIRNQIKHKKSSIIPPPSYCTRLSHLDETQNAKQEPANPHDSNPPPPTWMRGATASQRSLKPKQSVVPKPLCDAQGAQSAPKHLISRRMQCATGARAAYTTQIVRRYNVRCVSRLARPEVIVLFGTLSENTASLVRLRLKQLGELDWRCTVPLRRWPDDCMPTLWRIRVQPRAVFK